MYGALPARGMHVDVHWTDGRRYGATVVGEQNGYLLVQWDGGAQTAWVAPNQIIASAQPGPPPQVPVQQQAPWAAAAAQPPAPWAAAPAPPVAVPSQPTRVLRSRDGGPAHAMVFEPTAHGSGSGKSFFMFFGYKSSSERDRRMRAREIEHLGDDVAALRAAGYRVVVDLHGERGELDAALLGRHSESAGTQTVGVLWSGHGNEAGAIEAHDGDEIHPRHLSPEVPQNSALRLFVMSACHTGKYTEAWRTALGAQVQVIGWGAPITLERAVDFFTPDDASGKDFDDLLRSVLGVQRVTDDGPLTEIQSLAEALTAFALATEAAKASTGAVSTGVDPEVPNMKYEDLVAAAAERLGAHVKPDERNRYLTVSCTPPEGGPRGRTQLVRLFPNGDDDWLIYVISRAGIYSDAVDMVRALRGIANVRYTRIYLAPKDDNGQERITAEAGVLRIGMDPQRLAQIIQEVADTADHMEYMFFGSDDR